MIAGGPPGGPGANVTLGATPCTSSSSRTRNERVSSYSDRSSRDVMSRYVVTVDRSARTTTAPSRRAPSAATAIAELFPIRRGP